MTNDCTEEGGSVGVRKRGGEEVEKRGGRGSFEDRGGKRV